MKYYAIIREKDNKNDGWHFFYRDGYVTKKDFLFDLKANGYSVRKNKIYTKEEYYNLGNKND